MNDIVGMALSNAAAATLLALIVAAITHFARRPQVMHALWLLVLVKLITPPLVSLPLLAARVTESEPASAAVVPSALTSVSFDTPRSAPVGAPRAPAPEGHDEAPRQMIVPQLFTFLPTAAELLLCLWALGSLALVSLSVTRILRFDRRVWTLPRADESLQAAASCLAARLKLRCAPEVRWAEATVPPLLWVSIRQSIIVLPDQLASSLSPAGQRALVAHELAHLARRDYLVRLLEVFVLAIYWWHPVAWWARRRVHQAEEQCCDALAIRLLDGDAHGYGQTLLATLDFLSDSCCARPAMASAMGHFHDTRRRLAMILTAADTRRMTWRTWLLLAAAACSVLPMSIGAHASADWARLSPFTACDITGDNVQVEVGGTRYELIAMDGLTTAELLAAARKQYGDLWEKRFVEDIVEVMEHAGKRPGATVTLLLRDPKTGAEATIDKAPVTAENRQKAYRARALKAAQNGVLPLVAWARMSPFTAVDITNDRVDVEVNGGRYELISIDGLTTAQLLAAARKHYGELWEKRFVEDIVEVMEHAGKRPGEMVTLVLRDPKSGADFTIHKAPVTAENRQKAYLERARKLQRTGAVQAPVTISKGEEQDIRQLIKSFVKAAATNDRWGFAKTLSRHASDSGGRNDHYFDDAQRILKVAPRLMEVRSLHVVPDREVLAITDFFDMQDRNHPRMMCIVYHCVHEDGRWLIHDIDAEDVDGLVAEIGRRSVRAAKIAAERLSAPSSD